MSSYVFANAEEVKTKASSIIEEIKVLRRDAFEEAITEKMEEKKFIFFGRCYTREEAIIQLRNSWDNPEYNWRYDYSLAKDLVSLSSFALRENEEVLLSMKDVKFLEMWGKAI